MVPDWKKKQVQKFKEMMEQPVVGVIDIKDLPSAQFQEIRKELRGEAEMKIGRKTLIKRAMEETDNENVKKLEEYLEGPCGIISTDKGPFQLQRLLENNKSEAKAKPGKTVEKEVTVPEGPTNLQPGPVLGNLQKASLPAQIKGDKIVINQDTQVLEPGEEVTDDIALALNTLGIKPLEVGIELKALLEEETIFTPEDLHLDIEETKEELATAHQKSLNLSVEAGYFTKETTKLLISKAVQEAKNLAIEADILNEETIDQKIIQASSNAQKISQKVNE